jgi:large subunit ribosomal protein L15
MAGSGKRGDAKKTRLWDKRYFGKHGFRGRSRARTRSITLMQVAAQLPGWLSSGKASSEGDKVRIELDTLGYNKLLGTGQVKQAMIVVVKSSTPRAQEKIKKSGGEIISQVTPSTNE